MMNSIARIEKVVQDGFLAMHDQQRSEFMRLTEDMSSPDSHQMLIQLLAESNQVLTVHFAAGQMKKIFTESTNSFSPQERKMIRQELHNILVNRVSWFIQPPAAKSTPNYFALNTFCSLMARVWRICWFEIADNVDVEEGSDDDSDAETDLWAVSTPSGATFIRVVALPHLRMATSSTSGPQSTNGLSNPSNINANNHGNRSISASEAMNDPEADPLLNVVAKRLILDNPSIGSMLVGVSLLVCLVREMSEYLPNVWPSAQRKTAVAFRDRALFDIFKVGVSTMQKILSNPAPTIDAEKFQHSKLITTNLDLILAVFAFDFIGIHPDESSDEVGMLHVPTSWSSAFENTECLKTFFQAYDVLKTPDNSAALEILSQFASVRSSVFGSSNSQVTFLTAFFEGIEHIISSNVGLDDMTNITAVCRMLVRLKCNFQLAHFVSIPSWNTVSRAIAQWQYNLMDSEECTAGLLFYIMNFWFRLCAGLRYMAQTDVTNLPELVPIMTRQLMESLLKKEQQNMDDSLSSSFLEDKQLGQIFATLPTLLECTGKESFMVQLIDWFNVFGAQFAEYNAPAPPINDGNVPLPVLERQLALLVLAVTAIKSDTIGSTISRSDYPPFSADMGDDGTQLNPEEQTLEKLECELDSCSFNVLTIHDERFTKFGSTNSSKHLELSLACYLKRFSSIYFSNDTIEQTSLHKTLAEKFGFATRDDVLSAILSKVTMNLKNWSYGSDISHETLSLFLALVNGRISSRLVLKSELVAHLLQHHTELDLGNNPKNRREFYRVLGRVAFKDSEIDELYAFFAPFDGKLQMLKSKMENLSSSINDNRYMGDQLSQVALLCAETLNDLRGALLSCVSTTGYEMFFDWFYPSEYFDSILSSAIRLFSGLEWKPVWSAIKFLEEMISNTHGRIKFATSSPDGHKLFRDVSHLLIDFCGVIMNLTSSTLSVDSSSSAGKGRFASFGSSSSIGNLNLRRASDGISIQSVQDKEKIDTKFKAVELLLRVFSRLFVSAGSIANIGVFALYGDKVIFNLFTSVLTVIFSLNLEEVMAYPRLNEVLYIAVETICTSNIPVILGQDISVASDALGRILVMLKRGLRSKEASIVGNCTQAIDRIVTDQYFLLNRRRRPDAPPDIFNEQHTALLTEIMFELLDLVLTSSQSNHWALCRPLFMLIQLMPEQFGQIKSFMIQSQSRLPEIAQKLEDEFKALNEGLDNSMRDENRERFSNNALALKNACRQMLDFTSLYKEMAAVFGDSVSAPLLEIQL